MVLTSTPSGALIRVSDQEVGVTPGRLEVSRFEEIQLTLERSGYKTWSQTVSVEKPERKLHIKLKRIRPKRTKKRLRRRKRRR